MQIFSLDPTREDHRGDKEWELPKELRSEIHRFRNRNVAAIVAMGPMQEIGREGGLPWRLPEDLAHFKELTMGHPVIMGRKTWESLPKRPLPGRRNIVVSRQEDYVAEGGEVFGSLESAIAACAPDEEPFIIGGATIYEASIPYLTDLYVTEVETEVEGADTWFPDVDMAEWHETARSERMISKTGLLYRFRTLTRY